MAASHKLLIVHGQQGGRGGQELWMEDYLRQKCACLQIAPHVWSLTVHDCVWTLTAYI